VIDGYPSGGHVSANENEPLISLVLLMRTPRYLDTAILIRVAERAWGVVLDSDEPDAMEFVVGEMPTFVVQWSGYAFLVHSFPNPYFPDEDLSALSIADPDLRRIIAEHGAWVAVDLVGDAEGRTVRQAYQHIGQFIAELIDDDCLAIFAPGFDWLGAIEAGVQEKLRSSDPLSAIRDAARASIVQIAADELQQSAAVAEARRRWPEFVAAFERRRDDQTFAVRAPFHVGQDVKFMWMLVTGLENDTIYGVFDNDARNVKPFRAGDRVRVPVAELNDWLYLDGDEIVGGFSHQHSNEATGTRDDPDE
jgi:uncharacterized protein YegJ (DUF2314 family)